MRIFYLAENKGEIVLQDRVGTAPSAVADNPLHAETELPLTFHESGDLAQNYRKPEDPLRSNTKFNNLV